MKTIQKLQEETIKQTLKKLGFSDDTIALATCDLGQFLPGINIPADEEMIAQFEDLKKDLPKMIGFPERNRDET